MDPQKLSQLDPKLRDAYQRVMGTQLPDLQAPPAPTQDRLVQTQNPPPPPEPTSDPTQMPQSEPEPTPPPLPAEPDSIPVSVPTPIIEEPSLQTPVSEPESQPAINPQPEAPPIIEPTPISPEPTSPLQQNSISPNFAAPAPMQNQTMAIKKKGGMLTPVMTGIVILVFIAVYTLFWAKIFNFKLPFLP